MTSSLAEQISGPVLTPRDAAYAAEVAAFNTAVTHTPQVVVGVASAADVVEAIRYARAHDLRVSVQCTGHGATHPIGDGLLISTRRLDDVHVDPTLRTATFGAGVRWGAVVTAAAPHGLAPIIGSSPGVGAVGYLLGGGLGPLARSHGFSSDYLLGLTVATGAGELVEADAEHNPDLFWALRGGKGGLGVVTGARIRLAELPDLYAGPLFFDEPHIEPALRAWIDWTRTADPRVTTSVAIVNIPPFESVPPPLRGRRMLTLRFAYPGPADEGALLAEPVRAFAPVYLDGLGALPPAEVARIHNDPVDPGPSQVCGLLLGRVDQDFVTALLGQVGRDAPFVSVEVRHLGETTGRDVDGGSAASGRGAAYTLAMVAIDPASFARTAPEAVERIKSALAAWISPENNINFMAPTSAEEWATAWPAETFTRLAALRRRYDPDGVLALGYPG